MNGIEKITARIASEAETEAAAFRAEAEQQAEAIRSDYEAKAKAGAEARLLAGKEELLQRTQRADRSAKLEAKKTVLSVKQELIARAYEKARQEILGLPADGYVKFLAAQAAAAAAAGEGELLFNARDAAAVGPRVVEAANALLTARGKKAGLTLSADTREISGGLFVKNGNIEANCSLDSILELSRSELDAEVAGILFG